MSWQNAIFLDSSEKIVKVWNGDCEHFFQTVVPQDGFFQKNYVCLFHIALSEVFYL